MGTRADFYVGRGANAEWLGSIAFDGYPTGHPSDVIPATTEADYRARVAKMLAGVYHATLPEHGWPWPWDDSRTSDYAYAWDAGRVWGHGCCWFDATMIEPEEDEHECAGEGAFPDMSSRKAVTFGKRSGLIVISGS